ncbi:MarR family transcriptional regulator, partial (plasmid) [Rhizobium ruizarguesonis]
TWAAQREGGDGGDQEGIKRGRRT